MHNINIQYYKYYYDHNIFFCVLFTYYTHLSTLPQNNTRCGRRWPQVDIGIGAFVKHDKMYVARVDLGRLVFCVRWYN